MMVAVPAFQHSPMFGHLASSQTVASRCSCTMRRDGCEALAAGRAGPQPAAACRSERRRRASPARALMPSRIAVKPCGVTYFSPLRARAERRGSARRHGMSFELASWRASLYARSAGARPSSASRSGRAHVAPVAADAARRAAARPRWRASAAAAAESCPAGSPRRTPGGTRRRPNRSSARVPALDDAAAVEPEIPARVVRRIRHQHQVRERLRLAACSALKSMSVQTSPLTTRKGSGPSSGSALKMPPPVSSAHRPFVAVGDAHAVARAVAERRADAARPARRD